MTQLKKQALLVIDCQNDYFPLGKFPQYNTEQYLSNTKKAIQHAQAKDIAIIIVQHIADPTQGIAPFFNKGSSGAELHPELLELVGDAPIVVKHFADSFEQTNLAVLLQALQVTELLISGMMTQNCVTHTAISKSAEKYQVSVLADLCTSVDEMIHNSMHFQHV